jgi:hypothetical protein
MNEPVSSIMRSVRRFIGRRDAFERFYRSETKRAKALSLFKGKIKSFGFSRQDTSNPIISDYLLEHFDELEANLPKLIYSLAFVGRKEKGSILPDIPTEPKDDKPKWNKCDFRMIRAAEALCESCRTDLATLFHAEGYEARILDILGKKMDLFHPTRQFDDIRRLYWMLYAEMELTIRFLYPNLDQDWRFTPLVGRHYGHWIGLREMDLPILSYLRDHDINLYEADWKAFRGEALATVQKHYQSYFQYGPQSYRGDKYQISELEGDYSTLNLESYDILELNIPTRPRARQEVKFVLVSSTNPDQRTKAASISTTYATFLYFLAKECEGNSEGWLQNPLAHKGVLEEIKKVFSKALGPMLAQELTGNKYDAQSSWVFGDDTTWSQYVRRIRVSFIKAMGLPISVDTRGLLFDRYQHGNQGPCYSLSEGITSIEITRR